MPEQLTDEFLGKTLRAVARYRYSHSVMLVVQFPQRQCNYLKDNAGVQPGTNGFREIKESRSNLSYALQRTILDREDTAMTKQRKNEVKPFLEVLGLIEEPVGIFFTDHKPLAGFSPQPMPLPTREKETRNEIDWQTTFAQFSCVMGHVLRARKLKKTAYFSAEQFGCPGCAFWLGFNKPQTETIIHYVSTGIPGHMEGERYCSSPDALRRIFTDIDPEPAPGKFCVMKPLGLFSADEQPQLITFFARPESLSGLHQLATFVTNDPEVVASPWGAACTNIVTWPLKYLARGESRAVLGGWDPSARKFFSTDELTFTVPYDMFKEMLERFSDSFLMTATWTTVQKKIKRSNKAWAGKTG